MRIQDSEYEFPEEEWKCISEQAKDLIGHLLVKDPLMRYSAAEVLTHPWVSMESPQAQLATPQVLLRNNSVNGLEAFAESANAVNRMILRHLSISEAFDPSAHMRRLKEHDHSMPAFGVHCENDSPLFNNGDESDDQHDHGGGGEGDNTMFFIGDVAELSDEDPPDQAPILWMGLTPPGESSLARRRRAKSSTSSSNSQDEAASTPRAAGNNLQNPSVAEEMSKSPPKVPSAMF